MKITITEKDIIDEEKWFSDVNFRINYYYDKYYLNESKEKNEDDLSEYNAALNEFHNKVTIEKIFYKEKIFEGIVNSDPECINVAILYLGIDPFYYRSGYLKERLIHRLKKTRLSNSQRLRIQQLIIRIIRKCFRREFKYYCKLAWAVIDNEFNDMIKYLSEEEFKSNSVKTRAKYMLDYFNNLR